MSNNKTWARAQHTLHRAGPEEALGSRPPQTECTHRNRESGQDGRWTDTPRWKDATWSGQAAEPVPRGPRKSQLCKEKVNILFLMNQNSKHREKGRSKKVFV